MQTALRRLQSLEPPGVDAHSVAECLQLQLPAVACPQVRAVAKAISCDHLKAPAARDPDGLSRALANT